MVGLFTLGIKSSNGRDGTQQHDAVHPPPPPYDQVAGAPVVLATTTTTEVVTTTTQTTHFFSLPLWRKRGPVASSAHPSGTDDHGVLQPDALRAAMVDKALPPTPPNESDSDDQQAGPSSLDNSRSPSISTHSSPRPPEPRKSTMALAQAALGVGLPHIIPRASPSSSSTEVNSIAFLSSASRAGSSSGVRRSKSTHKPKPSSTTEDGGPPVRARNISLGATALLPNGNGAKGKGKEREAEGDGNASPKVLSRRPSFWSRKKQAAPSELERPRSEFRRTDLPSPSLPALPPISPFFTDDRLTGSPEPSMAFARPRSGSLMGATQRPRTAYVTGSQNEMSAYDAHRMSLTSSPPRRPMTADSSTRSPTRSMFLTTSPLPDPLRELPASPPSPTSTTELHARRPRAQTNPPILHRLSLNLFSSPFNNSSVNNSASSTLISARTSPRTSISRRTVEIPRPGEHDESPETYLGRLRAAVSKAEIAGVLASSATPFHVRALRAYLEEFNFSGDALDVAVRKLLLDVGLPRETQQIDRVIEAFAVRYLQCNPDLFTSDDHPYILAFSLIMLHTDAFNKSNKRKMTKADYVRNTRLPGVPSEVLDCFYDNIVFAPFIFIEDPLDVNGQRGFSSEGLSRKSSVALFGNVSNGVPARSNKVDPYYLITNNLLDPLRVNMEVHVPLTNPYSFEGTSGPWNEDVLQRAFAKATVLEVGAVDHTRASPFFGLSVGGAPSPLLGNMGAIPEVYFPSSNEVWTLKVAKVGLLQRKDDVLHGGKKSTNRKWRPLSVILTGSQLLFFRDPSWATALAARTEQTDGQIIFPQATIFKPDELLSVKGAVAVYDKSYTRHEHTLRLAMSDGRQFLLRMSDEKELNDWIACINYASAFKSAGVRMRALAMSGKDVQLTGVAAAASHLHDLEHQAMSGGQPRKGPADSSQDLIGMLPGENGYRRDPKRRVTLIGDSDEVDTDVPMAPEVDGADQLAATFDQVKAELAAGNWDILDDPTVRDVSNQVVPTSPVSQFSERSPLPSRSQIITSKIHELDLKITAAQGQLDADLRFTRNIAILSPFQKATRDRLELAVQGVARRIMQMRLEIARHECHREVLSKDLASEERDWQQAKQLALKAAAETLQSRGGKPIPLMTLSFHDEDSPSTSPITPSQGLSAHRPASSICESFHSALDFGSEWPSPTEETRSSPFLSASHVFDSPGRNSSASSVSFPDVDAAVPKGVPGFASPDLAGRHTPQIASPRSSSSEAPHHERFYTAQESTAEVAEAWNKTRCAQRVSLVRLPSDLRIPDIFEKHQSPLKSA
ncbi:hypothetical protein HGRIS_007727 [Hohenbuehelia grisea]|uniref:Uncharacterized protein n=1 Tax=Hohenbuehelia grisea TaxID=104357 RepID=A0ABR3J744_9AGAR